MGNVKKKKQNRKVLLRDMTDGEGYQVATHTGTLFLLTYGRGKNKTVGIYGDPVGLRFLAGLLSDVADVNQGQIPDINCPPSEGAHYHIYRHDGYVHPKSTELMIGRLDAKKNGSFDWFLPLADK